MWFKQAQIFQLTKPCSLTAEQLAEYLEPLAFTPCLPSFPASYGWTSPFNAEDAPLVHFANNCLLLCMQFEEKILPSTVVKQAVNEKVKQIAAQFDRKVYNKEKLTIKDEMTQTLLPRAFSKYSKVYAYIDTQNNWLILDTVSATKTEKFLELLRRSCEDLEFEYLETKKVPLLLTNWLLDGDFPNSFSIEKSCVLRDPQQQTRVIRCQQQELSADPVITLLKDGCEVHQLSCAWHDRVNFNLTEKFTLTGIRFHDTVLELAKDSYSESENQKIDADFFIMTETLQGLLKDLLVEFGEGESKVATPREVEMA